MKIIKVNLIGPFPPPLHGMSLSNKILYNYLQKRDEFEVHIIDTSEKTGRTDKQGRFSILKVFKALKNYLKSKKTLRNTDIMYLTIAQSVFGFLKYVPYMFLAEKLNITYFIHLHGGYLAETFKNSNSIIKKIMKKYVSKAKGCIVLSERLKKHFRIIDKNVKIYVVYNFVETEFFSDIKKIQKPNEIKILFLSNLYKEKGILDLLKAAKILKEKNIKFSLDIAGVWDKKTKNEGLNLIKDMGDNITYHGFVTGFKKKKLLFKNNIFVLPTFYLYEGQPISILEAMASGNLIITTRRGGISDIINEGKNGFFVPKETPKAIADRLEWLYYNKKVISMIAKNNIKEAKKKYTIERFGRDVVNIFIK